MMDFFFFGYRYFKFIIITYKWNITPSYEEIIKSSLWINDVIYYFTKRLSLV